MDAKVVDGLVTHTWNRVNLGWAWAGAYIESISWYTAFKVAIFVAILAGLAGALAEQGVVTSL